MDGGRRKPAVGQSAADGSRQLAGPHAMKADPGTNILERRTEMIEQHALRLTTVHATIQRMSRP
jgi:hypothetical protein